MTDAPDVLSNLRSDHDTALSRLGSSKWLYALTGGEMDENHVRAAVADDAAAAQATFEAWADDEASEAAAELFEAGATAAAAHRETFAPDDHDPAAPRALYGVLDDYDDAISRVGGFLARAVVAGTTAAQVVGFFVGSASIRAADDARDLRADLEAQQSDAVEVLGGLCESGDDWERAREAADAVVDAAYEDYVETLEGLGVKPKNVC